MEKEAHVNYDEEEDILSVSLDEKVVESLPIDNFVIDLSSTEHGVGLEIFNASKVISGFSGIKVDSYALKRIKKAYLRDFKSKELLFVVVRLLVKLDEKEKEIDMQAPLPISAVSK
ncbi:MAG: DUF2283 domain-containing protein [Candidatus Parvarchaeum sp.]